MAKTRARRRGPPPKFGPRVTLTCRLQGKHYERIKAEAADNGRSISEEIERRIEQSFTDDAYWKAEKDARESVEASLDKALQEIHALHQQEVLVTQFQEKQDTIIQKLDALLGQQKDGQQ